VAATTSVEIDERMAAADAAFSTWSSWPPARRAGALDRVADALDQAAEELVATADAETALGEPRLRGELARTTGQLRLFGAVLREGNYVDAVITTADDATARPDIRRMLTPIGPVVVFAASNFPFAFSVLGGDTASALAAGCPVVVKAHEAHPQTSRRTWEIAQVALSAAGCPDGVLGIAFGFAAGAALVRHPLTRAAGFTGSQRGGRALFDVAAGRPDPIPFYGEFGSVNPVFVLPQAAREHTAQIAAGYVGSLTQGGGQFCTNPGLLFVPDEPALLSAIADAIAGVAATPMLSRGIHSAYLRGAEAMAGVDGVSVLARGVGGGDDRGGWMATPQANVVSVSSFAQHAGELAEECFGPAGLIVTYRDAAELGGVVDALAGNLTASIHAEGSDHELAGRLATPLARKVGRLIFNGWPTGVAVSWATHHGGPWPATSAAAHTSVGATAIARWLAPVAYQSWPDDLLPSALRRDNPLHLARRVDDTFPD
jgi:NADP-dependent aldehyde dehydrogenase